MTTKVIEINGWKFALAKHDDGRIQMRIHDVAAEGVLVLNMTKEQCSTLGDVLKIVSGQMREHSI